MNLSFSIKLRHAPSRPMFSMKHQKSPSISMFSIKHPPYPSNVINDPFLHLTPHKHHPSSFSPLFSPPIPVLLFGFSGVISKENRTEFRNWSRFPNLHHQLLHQHHSLTLAPEMSVLFSFKKRSILHELINITESFKKCLISL